MIYRIASWRFHSRGAVGAVLVAIFGALVILSSPAIVWPNVPTRFFEVLGWLVFLTGAALRFWATLYVGGRKVGGRRELKLVDQGPYSLCRNPLYLGTMIIALSAPIMLQCLTLLLGVVVGALFYALATIPAEEEFLRDALGAQFDRYCQRVPRFLPRWSNFKSPRYLEIDVKALGNEFRRAARWVWVPVIVQLLAHSRTESWWPHLIQLP